MSQDRQTAQRQSEEVRAAPRKVLFETGSGVDPSGTSPWDLRHAGVHSWQPQGNPHPDQPRRQHSPKPLLLFKDPLAAAREKEEAPKESESSPSCPRSSPLGMGIADTLPSTWGGSQGTLPRQCWDIMPLNHPSESEGAISSPLSGYREKHTQHKGFFSLVWGASPGMLFRKNRDRSLHPLVSNQRAQCQQDGPQDTQHSCPALFHHPIDLVFSFCPGC